MANHIPTGFSPNAGQSNSGGDKDFGPPHIFDDGATVNFRVHKVTDNTRKRTFGAGTDKELVLEDCELWSFQLILTDPTDSSLSNMTFLDIIKDGRAWNVESAKGSLWVQNKFINMCTGMGLRSSKEVLNINPEWFSNTSLYSMQTGQCTVQKDSWNGAYRNQINWFNEPHVQPAPMHTLIEGEATITTFQDPAANEIDPADRLPFPDDPPF